MKEEIIERKKCKKCSLIQHASHLRCLRCNFSEFDPIQAKGVCKLITYTILKAPPMEFRNKEYYPIGVVEFENGIKAMGQLSQEEGLKVGMRLKPVFEKICNDLFGEEVFSYIFYPA